MRESRSSRPVSPSSTSPLSPASASLAFYQRWGHWIGHGAAVLALGIGVRWAVVEQEGKMSAQREVAGARRELVDAWREVEEVRRAKVASEVKAKEEVVDLGQRLAKEGEERRRYEREAGEARTQLWAMWGRAQSYRSQWEAAEKDRSSAEAEAKERVAVAEKQKAELEVTVDALQKANQEAEAQVNHWRTVATMKAQIYAKAPQGKVLAAEPGWGFLVVNVGDKQGVKPNGMLMVARDGSAIGKVKVTSVERDQAVAELVPGTFGKGAGVRRGDLVVGVGE